MADPGQQGQQEGAEAAAGAAATRAVVDRQIGGLALSEVEGTGILALLRAVAWHNVLARLGFSVPLVVVHDLGVLVAGIGRPASVRQGAGDPRLGEAWRTLLVELSEADIVRVQAAWKHRDAMVGVVLARVLGVLRPQLPDAVRLRRPVILPLDATHYTRTDPRSAFARYEQEEATAWIRTMVDNRLLPVLEIEQIDMDALRLLGLFRGGSGEVGGVDLADLYNVVVSSTMSDVVDFSLELLPSLLEVRRDAGQQTFGIDGYAAVERVGHLDQLVLSQLAYDEDVFLQKLADNELFFYTHEKQYEAEQRRHLVLVDGSASMRGVREVFARGLALALCKRLALLGEDVTLRFFDSRLYEGVPVSASGQEVPYVLQFRAERGRNYAAVIRQLNAELAAPRRGGGQTLVYILTHGECQLPRDEVQLLASRAPIYGVFVLPSGPLELGYLDLLHRVHVVDEEAVGLGRRATKARQIIDEVEGDLERERGRRRPRGRGGGER